MLVQLNHSSPHLAYWETFFFIKPMYDKLNDYSRTNLAFRNHFGHMVAAKIVRGSNFCHGPNFWRQNIIKLALSYDTRFSLMHLVTKEWIFAIKRTLHWWLAWLMPSLPPQDFCQALAKKPFFDYYLDDLEKVALIGEVVLTGGVLSACGGIALYIYINCWEQEKGVITNEPTEISAKQW